MKYIIIFILINLFIFVILSLTVPSWCVYISTLKRTNKQKWSREDTEAIYPPIRTGGAKWYEAHKHLKKDVSVMSGGLKLCGEYYDLGYDRAVIILTGRTDTVRYACYFAQPYEEAGYNILLIDPRAHGESEGDFNTAGFEESKDVIVWSRFIHDNYSVNSIILHGICIGAAGGMLAMTNPECPDYIHGLVAEGMFTRFSEIIRTHLIDRNKPTGFLLKSINMWMKHYTGHDMFYGPIDVIENYNKPILMLHGHKDIFSRPEGAKELFEKCPSKNKEIIWFEDGDHSLLRPYSTQKYDRAIMEFINKNFK